MYKYSGIEMPLFSAIQDFFRPEDHFKFNKELQALQPNDLRDFQQLLVREGYNVKSPSQQILALPNYSKADDDGVAYEEPPVEVDVGYRVGDEHPAVVAV